MKTQILAMFTLAEDKNKGNTDFKHLITSVVKYDRPILYDILEENLRFISEKANILKRWEIFHIKSYSYEEGNDRALKDLNYIYNIEERQHFKLIHLNLYILLNKDLFNKYKESVWNHIFKKYEYGRDNEKISSRTLFIFEDISWENIVLLFKLNNLHISGGSSSKRHLISPIDINLIEFLLCANNFDIGLSNIYKSFNDDFFSKGSIDLIKLKEIKSLTNADNYKDKDIIRNYLVNNEILNNRLKYFMELNNIYDKSLKMVGKIEDKYSKIIEIYDLLIEYQEDINSSINYILLKGSNKWELNSIESNDRKILQLKEQILEIEKDLNNMDEECIIMFDRLESIYKTINFNHEKYHKLKYGLSFIGSLNKASFNTRFFSTRPFLENNIKYNINIQPIPILDNKNITEKNDSIFTYLEYIEDIIRESNNDPMSGQIKIEYEWLNYTKLKLDNYNPIKIKKNLVYIIKKAEETLNILIDNKKLKRRFPKYYKKLGVNELLITISIIISRYNWSGFTSISLNIANDIIFNLYLEEIVKPSKKNNIDAITINEFEKNLGITNDIHKLKLGAFFIEIFCSEPTKIFERSYKNQDILENGINDQDLAILIINEEYFDLFKRNVVIHPNSLPMLCKPKEWNDNKYGGFILNEIKRKGLIAESIGSKHFIEDKTKLYNAINYLNSFKFKINTELLYYLENDGQYILNKYINDLESKSEKLHANITIKIAKIYSKITIPFYINTFADWRGRIYSHSYYINYQGNDLSSALLNFYDGSTITDKGRYYLYIYGANCYNNKLSKESFDTRVKWVKDNYEDIINLEPELILKAESIFLFLSFCLTMKELKYNPNKIIYLPIYLDATCSGIQHLAAMLKDFETGSKVNLIPQKSSDKVSDLYSELIEPINGAINKFGREEKGFEYFQLIKLDRSHIKPPIMTKVYNVSVVGIADQLRSVFKKYKYNKLEKFLVPTIDNNTIEISYGDVFKIAQIIDKQIFISLPSLKHIFDYFKNIIRLLVKLNIPIIWFTPAGLRIRQQYLQTKQNKISITFTKTSKKVILREVIDNIDKNKQIQSIIPNIIHSLDASHLINLINTSIKLKFSPIISIHDCFGTHPNNIEKLIYLIKIEFIILYTKENFLVQFHKNILDSLKINHYLIFKDKDGKDYIQPARNKIYIPELVSLGDLDLKKIKDSKYIIT